MNLTDYPTPRSAAMWDTAHDEGGCNASILFEAMEQIEREAAAWRDVATMFYEADWRDDEARCDALTAFDRLLAETNGQVEARDQ